MSACLKHCQLHPRNKCLCSCNFCSTGFDDSDLCEEITSNNFDSCMAVCINHTLDNAEICVSGGFVSLDWSGGYGCGRDAAKIVIDVCQLTCMAYVKGMHIHTFCTQLSE